MTTHTLDAQGEAARGGDAIVRFPDFAKATPGDFVGDKNVIFIHGFTAAPNNLADFMKLFQHAGFRAFAFRYESYRGIDRAAMSLVSLLKLLDSDGCVSRNKVVLLGHSMGGLVARAAVVLAGGHVYARKVITVGTPNDGTLRDAKIPLLFASLAEVAGGLNPRGFSKKAVSARQLMKADASPALLDRLNSNAAPDHVDYCSFSGGYTKLDFGTGFWKNLLANSYLQSRLKSPNDGLVEEGSSDLSNSRFARTAPGTLHNNQYASYGEANHTHIIENHEVELMAVRFAE